MNPWLYAALCVVVPVVWGMVVVALSNAFEHLVARRSGQSLESDPPVAHQPESKKRTLPPIDYHI